MQVDFAACWEAGLAYTEFLDRYATPEHRRRWDDVYAQVELSDAQRQLLQSFRRELRLLVLAGAWCGDCINQCPIFEHFAQAADCLQVRYCDRDAHGQLQQALSLCGGARVPVVVFLNEDGQFCGLYGDRTLATYRALAARQLGPACPTGIGVDVPLLQAVVQDWLDEVERVQLMLRLSPRLRQKHGD
jgi:thiol-disulfide isomerase/thioredoxin